jgi:4-azaleucine resistance transporter AzlC
MDTKTAISDRQAARSVSGDIRRGVILTLPMLLVFGPIGATFGVIATEAGMSPFQTILMSFVVYTGAAQLAAIQLLIFDAPLVTVYLTTLVINSRLLVLSATLAPHLSKFGFFLRLFYGLQLTDASFAIHVSHFAKAPPRRVEVFTTNIFAHVIWVVGTSIGVIAGSAVPDPAQIGLDFAMPAMFIALAIPLIRSKAEVVVAITSGLAVIGFNAIGFQHWTILAATAVAMIVAFGAIRWKRA